MAWLKLVVVHYHWRPGGVRRVIELALPHLARGFEARQVVLAGGEQPEAPWEKDLREKLAPTPVHFFVEPTFGYVAQQRRSPGLVARRLAAALDRLLAETEPKECLVWAHNLGVGRNLLLSRALAQTCGDRKIRLVSHHHDWWFENRWRRWPEMQRCGFTSPESVATAIFGETSKAHHLAINHADASRLQRHFPKQAVWLPNLMQPFPAIPRERLKRVRSWLERQVGSGDAPLWILPSRLLRRKNVAEALLLTRWLRPEAWLFNTAGVSSKDELPYVQALERAARKHQWPLHVGVLQNAPKDSPTVPELMGISETVLMTSVQEGFGLPYMEAAAAQRPIIARAIPNISPDLHRFGFRFPQLYNELLVHPALFDWEAEACRQKKLFAAWCAHMPQPYRSWASKSRLPNLEGNPEPLPFSRLTLTAQLEVLTQPTSHSWKLCAGLNSFLEVWRRRAATGGLGLTPWPKKAELWLSGQAYARRFRELLRGPSCSAPPSENGIAAQEDFIRQKLEAQNLFPILWASRT